MSQLHPRNLIYLLLPLAACGGRVVEFPLNGNLGDDTASGQPPTVLNTVPQMDATEVALDHPFSATFSEPMSPETLNTDTFTVTDGTNRLPGLVYYDDATETATFLPDGILSLDTHYTAEVTAGAEDAGGMAMVRDYGWSFTTTPVDAPPFVRFVTPIDGGEGALVSVSATATFSEQMAPGTLNTQSFTLEQGAIAVAGAVTYDASTRTATFTPAAALDYSLPYTATITTDAEDLGGLGLVDDHAWTFSTQVNDIPPQVVRTTPRDGAVDVVVGFEPTATFSADMNPATLNDLTFVLRQGTDLVPGAVDYDPATLTATFTPDFDLDHHLPYTGTITTGAEDLGGLSIPHDYLWSFTTEVNTTPPEVIFSSPLNGSIDVLIGAEPTATFSADMNPATVNDVTFTLHQGTTPILGVVNYDPATLTATFTPDVEMDFSHVYYGTITTGAADVDGLPLVANFLWSFTTQVNNIPPVVIATTPLNGAVNVLVGAPLTATFSVDMDPLTIDDLSFTLDEGSTVITGTVLYDAMTHTATFTPDLTLDSNALYTATINTLAEDPGGLALVADHVWTFTTETVIYPPAVVSTTPLDAAIDVSINTRPTATFTVDMDPMTVTDATFTVMDGVIPVAGTVTYDAASYTATFTPDQILDLSTTYTVTLSATVEDMLGTPMGTDFVWEITTAACSVADIDLGSSSVFALLASSTVTNTGATVVTGDLGLSPGTAVTGFPPGLLVGTLHAGDATAATARTDLSLAFIEAASRTACPVAVAGNLGGSTLPPGLYKSTSSLEITSGDLTLDALGDADAVFLFQIASTFNASTGRAVVLANGAKAANVYWKVGSSATLGTYTVMKGNFLADQGITMGTGADLEGRAMSRVAAVTLDTCTVASPAP